MLRLLVPRRSTEGLVAGGREHPLRRSCAGDARPSPIWPAAACGGQARFLAGLDALHAAGALHDFEPSKRDYIGGHGDAPILLVQGPPGTGKSYSTAFALFARLQGAMAAGRDFRVFLSCKTHAATDVLLDNVRPACKRCCADLPRAHPAIFGRYFDPRLLDVPLFRLRPRGDAARRRDRAAARTTEREPGEPKAVDAIQAARWCVVAATPGGIYGSSRTAGRRSCSATSSSTAWCSTRRRR